jgi:Tfp pilus assembly major pilin PilA
MTYRGDAFEALVEVLIKASPIDKRINIINYRPWNTSQDGPDVGVDGLGLSHNGKPHTIQVKFRSKASEQLTANKDHISNFVAKSDTMYHTDQDMTIFTTASALMETVNNEMYGGRVRTIGFKEISKLIDKNESFWSIFRHEMNVV